VADATLRLSVDVSAVPARPVGAGYYTMELVTALAERTDLDLLLLARRADGFRWSGAAPGRRVVADAPGPRPLRLAWEQARVPSLLTRAGVSVHHGPHYTMPEWSSVPTVVTIHDLSFFEAPEWHERSKVWLFKRAIKVAARQAAAVVCPSQVTADELRRWCRVDAPVFIAHHGVDASRFRPDEPAHGADAEVLSSLDRRLGGAVPILVFVGTLEPRKDVPSLVRAFAQVARRHPDALLVLAGGAGWGADEVDRAVAETGLSSRIVRTGYVADEAICALLRSATAVVYPALYEGFGLPALEALACGARLVTTSGTAMEEVAGDACVLVPPGDVGALSEAIEAELTGPAARTRGDDERRARGLAIASRHTWDESAARHMEAYRHAAAR
jgi:glycosyltransferase involved in cell wall biosynthesis